jgi:hypothetical protein
VETVEKKKSSFYRSIEVTSQDEIDDGLNIEEGCSSLSPIDILDCEESGEIHKLLRIYRADNHDRRWGADGG